MRARQASIRTDGDKRVLVLCWGNPGRLDDGLGPCLAGRLAAARKLEDEGRLGRAHVAFAELADDADGGVFTERAAHGVTRSTQAARRALVRARDLAGSPPGVPAALAELERAETTFGGSPLAEDFRAVRERTEATGAFPEVRPAD